MQVRTLGQSMSKFLVRGNPRSLSWAVRRLHDQRPIFSPPTSQRSLAKSHTLTLSRRISSQPPLTDPSRPDVFYHLTSLPHPSDLSQSTPVYAVSFLQSTPPSARSPTIIGWLPAVGEGEHNSVEVGLNDFVENPRFRPLMHKAIKEALHQGADDVWKNGALQLQQGWMHIHDNRNIPALGRIGDPDDIIASVFVENGNILPDTYQAMPSYRICTSDGPTQLTEGLAKKLNSLLEESVSRESS